MRARARRLKRQHGLSLIVVDYLQLLTGSTSRDRVQQVGEISRTGMEGAGERGALAVHHE
jgi:replicative DNA helicase